MCDSARGMDWLTRCAARKENERLEEELEALVKERDDVSSIHRDVQVARVVTSGARAGLSPEG